VVKHQAFVEAMERKYSSATNLQQSLMFKKFNSAMAKSKK